MHVERVFVWLDQSSLGIVHPHLEIQLEVTGCRILFRRPEQLHGRLFLDGMSRMSERCMIAVFGMSVGRRMRYWRRKKLLMKRMIDRARREVIEKPLVARMSVHLDYHISGNLSMLNWHVDEYCLIGSNHDQ